VYIAKAHLARLNTRVSVQNSVKPNTRLTVCSECEVADEPVVALKSRPEKAGNRVEDKIKTTVNSDLTG
jgi:hypothetical protein